MTRRRARYSWENDRLVALVVPDWQPAPRSIIAPARRFPELEAWLRERRDRGEHWPHVQMQRGEAIMHAQRHGPR